MMPGPDRVIACPSCKGLETYLTLRSFTEWDVFRWTDGFRLCYSRPKPPPVTKCGHCSFVYWLKDAEVVGELPRWGETDAPSEWQKAEHVVEPSEADYYEALASGLGRSAEEECNARVLAWWKSNEPLRGDILTGAYQHWNGSYVRGDRPKIKREIGAWNPNPVARQTNMEHLLSMLDLSNVNGWIFRVEVLRQLGRFDEALAALQDVGFEKASWVLDPIRALCEEEHTLVKLLHDPNRPNFFKAAEEFVRRANPGQT